jgi:hypothetical protein
MLGKALDYHQNSCETPCCSWAAFKLARYLTQFTGEARYGDWIERLMYNGVGGILWIKDAGRHFYYADYRVAGGVKVYAREIYTCCSGSYVQAVSDFPNQIYYRDPTSLYVSLYLPSEVTWNGPGGEIKVTQETAYPEAETSAFTVNPSQSAAFALKFRVPGWSNGMTVRVNGAATDVPCKPGTWAVVQRTWAPGDRVEIRIPLRFRFSAVDPQHPHRIAVVRGQCPRTHLQAAGDGRRAQHMADPGSPARLLRHAPLGRRGRPGEVPPLLHRDRISGLSDVF